MASAVQPILCARWIHHSLFYQRCFYHGFYRGSYRGFHRGSYRGFYLGSYPGSYHGFYRDFYHGFYCDFYHCFCHCIYRYFYHGFGRVEMFFSSDVDRGVWNGDDGSYAYLFCYVNDANDANGANGLDHIRLGRNHDPMNELFCATFSMCVDQKF